MNRSQDLCEDVFGAVPEERGRQEEGVSDFAKTDYGLWQESCQEYL